MSGWWLSGFLVVSVSVTVVNNTKVDLDSPLRLAHCRATCLHKLNMVHLTDKRCQKSTNCSQCWKTCQLLQDVADIRAYCYQRACGPACMEACSFHSLSPTQHPPVLLTQHEEALSFSGSRVYFPTSASEAIHVFVVMGREGNKPWSELCQTLDLSIRVSPTVDLGTVRVLEVDWRGLTKVFSPPAESPLVRARTIIRSLGLGKTMGQQTRGGESAHRSAVSIQQNTSKSLWRLKESSIIHKSGLVLAQVSWEPQELDSASQQTYLVTWELDGGILRGNLLTNSTYVTLSLWPDTVYRIQVTLFNPEIPDVQSESLVLDTHHVCPESPSVTLDHLDTQNQLLSHSLSGTHETDGPAQLVTGVAAAVAMFLLVILSLTWRWHHHLSLPHAKLIDEEIGTPNLYRSFPPAVRLIGERQDVFPGVFSSTENLLQNN